MNVAIEAPTSSVNVIDGHCLAHGLRHLDSDARAYLAWQLSTGEIVLLNPTRGQTAVLAGVSVGSIRAFARPLRWATSRQPIMSDAALEDLIARVGLDRVLSVLDRIA